MISMREAKIAYRIGNDAGNGYAPDTTASDSVDDAVACALEAGATLMHARLADTDVAVLQNEEGRVIAIGGDAMGRNAWAVDITDTARAKG